MENKLKPMDKFNFLLGKWKLEYKIPKSQFSDGNNGEGEGEFRRILNDKYVCFDYRARLSNIQNAAHGIFVWEKKNIYKYWWFEDSGAFMEATCNFINENTLCLNWHNSLLVQTFQKLEADKIVLHMKHPTSANKFEIILEVILTKN